MSLLPPIWRQALRLSLVLLSVSLFLSTSLAAAETAAAAAPRWVKKPELYKAITEPPCSYCSTEHRKGFVDLNDTVVAWIRGDHNGGAIPLRHFLAGPRIINDTYGLFFYDPDGGYVSAFRKDYGYTFYGWRNGVMIARGKDGTLWSALTGLAIDGPKKGERLERIPSMMTTWGYWLMLHPESTAYNLFEGKTYPVTNLPESPDPAAAESLAPVPPPLKARARIYGIEVHGMARAYPLDPTLERACYRDTLNGQALTVFWYAPTQSAVAFKSKLGERTLTFRADSVSPESAPFKDKETGTRWTLAGRGIDGPLRGQELEWVPGIQCFWSAWSAEYPETTVHEPPR